MDAIQQRLGHLFCSLGCEPDARHGQAYVFDVEGQQVHAELNAQSGGRAFIYGYAPFNALRSDGALELARLSLEWALANGVAIAAHPRNPGVAVVHAGTFFSLDAQGDAQCIATLMNKVAAGLAELKHRACHSRDWTHS